MNRVIHFEIPANDSKKVIEFYKNVFGWNVQQWGEQEYWLAFTGDQNEKGINGAFFKPKSPMHGDGFVNTIGVANIDQAAEKVKANGGQIVVEKVTIPNMGYYLYCKDIEGTLFGLMQEDVNAK
jgi:predicted enzyme related to lactoylglutathione lyase